MSEPAAVASPTGAPTPPASDAAAPRHGRARTAGAPDGRDPSARRPRRTARLWLVGAVLVVAFGFLLAKGLGSSLNYFETVDQAVAHKATLGARTFRLEGVVVAGTVRRDAGGVRFVAAGTKHRVQVVNHGNPPQLFQASVPVVVVGHFSGSTFVSDQVIVDHSAQYVQAHPDRVRAPNGTVR